MRIFRPALLALLASSVAGVGVPAGFGQAKVAPRAEPASGKSASSKSTSAKTSPSANTPAKSALKKTAPSNSAAKSHHATSVAGKKAPVNSSRALSTTPARKTSGKSSKRSSRKQPGQKAPTADRVIEIQTALAKDGSFQGSPSGKWDDDTAVAMRKFQAAHGLSANGKLDAPTLQRLGLGSQTAGVAAPTPPPGAISRLTSSNNTPTGNIEPSRRQ